MSEHRKPPPDAAAIQTADFVARVIVWLFCTIALVLRFLVTVTAVLGGRLTSAAMDPRVTAATVAAIVRARDLAVLVWGRLHGLGEFYASRLNIFSVHDRST
jgi:hypothetical protein